MEHVAAHVLLRHPRSILANVFLYDEIKPPAIGALKALYIQYPSLSFYLTFGRVAPPSSIEKSC